MRQAIFYETDFDTGFRHMAPTDDTDPFVCTQFDKKYLIFPFSFQQTRVVKQMSLVSQITFKFAFVLFQMFVSY